MKKKKNVCMNNGSNICVANTGGQIWTICFELFLMSESYSMLWLGHTLAFNFSSVCAEIPDPNPVSAIIKMPSSWLSIAAFASL